MSVAHITTREYSQGSHLEPSGSPGPVQNWPYPSVALVLWTAGPTSHWLQYSRHWALDLTQAAQCPVGRDVGELAWGCKCEDPATCLPWGGTDAVVMHLPPVLCLPFATSDSRESCLQGHEHRRASPTHDPCPQLAAALRRSDPTPSLGNTMGLAQMVKA